MDRTTDDRLPSFLERRIVVDGRRVVWIGRNRDVALRFAVQEWFVEVMGAQKRRGLCTVALAGGQTPAAVYERLADSPRRESVNWDQLWCYFGDERAVDVSSPDSNAGMALRSGWDRLPLPKDHFFPMPALQGDEGAQFYEARLKERLLHGHLDLALLGVGGDGHVASLFPSDDWLGKDLQGEHRWVTCAKAPSGAPGRMTLTLRMFQQSRRVHIYLFGKEKSEIAHKIFCEENKLPACRVGSRENPPLWILDIESAQGIAPHVSKFVKNLDTD